MGQGWERFQNVPAPSTRSTGLKASFAHALDGIRDVAATERNFRLHLVAAALVAVFGFSLPLRTGEALALALCVGGVLAAELFNSAIEAVVDLLSERWDARAKRAKDAAAGAVLTLSLFAAGVAVFVGAAALGREGLAGIAPLPLFVGLPVVAGFAALLFRRPARQRKDSEWSSIASRRRPDTLDFTPSSSERSIN